MGDFPGDLGELPGEPIEEVPGDPHAEVPEDPHAEVPEDPVEEVQEDPHAEVPVEAAKESEAQEQRRKLIKKDENFTMISNIGSVGSIRKMKLRRTGGRNIPRSIRGRFRFI